MSGILNRRSFLKTSASVLAASGAGTLAGRTAFGAATGSCHGKPLGWNLCCAAYSFNKLSFYETIEKLQSLGIGYLEGFEWQKLSPNKPKATSGPDLSAADRKEARKRLDDAGVKLIGCYCRKLEEEQASRKMMEFARDMGIEYLVAEPPFEAYDMLEKLCDEYEVKLAVHNHPAPSRYYDPATVLKMVKDRGPRIGACCDTGHWVRSGFDPVEALKKLEGHIVSFHLKDVDSFGNKKAECVPWGTGAGKIGPILEEMHRQKFKGTFAIEYEPYRPENYSKIQQCVEFFDAQVAKLARA